MINRIGGQEVWLGLFISDRPADIFKFFFLTIHHYKAILNQKNFLIHRNFYIYRFRCRDYDVKIKNNVFHRY